MARGALGGVPPSPPRHTRGYETRFHRSRLWRGGLWGVSPLLPLATRAAMKQDFIGAEK
jgi:hypothetical protein